MLLLEEEDDHEVNNNQEKEKIVQRDQLPLRTEMRILEEHHNKEEEVNSKEEMGKIRYKMKEEAEVVVNVDNHKEVLQPGTQMYQ